LRTDLAWRLVWFRKGLVLRSKGLLAELVVVQIQGDAVFAQRTEEQWAEEQWEQWEGEHGLAQGPFEDENQVVRYLPPLVFLSVLQ
jgi:hypothetical protein